MFYLKLAWGNLKTSLSVFAPFVLASLVLFSLLGSTNLVLASPVVKQMQHGSMLLMLAVIVLTMFAAIMEVYSYNFLLKQRSREFGLYNVLGMNKGQVSWIATLELLCVFLVTVLLGSVVSSICSHILYLIFVRLTAYDRLDFTINPTGLVTTVIIFACIFCLLEGIGLFRIQKSSPLILFRTQERAEKEPRGNGMLAFLALLCLGGGYMLSITSSKIGALVVLARFFIAVILVIIGTYLFYISFTTWFLKNRRADKAYFYKPEHFITTSQMLFRMKQNAVGLGNITLLAIMAFVTVATTFSLYSNATSMSDALFPENTRVDFSVTERAQGEAAVAEIFGDKDKREASTYLTTLLQVNAPRGTTWSITEEQIASPDISVNFAYLMTQDDFRGLGNELPKLGDKESALYVQNGHYQIKTIDFLGQEFENVANLSHIKMPDSINTYNAVVLVVANDKVLAQLLTTYQAIPNNRFTSDLNYTAFVHVDDQEFDATMNRLKTWNAQHPDQAGWLQTQSDFLTSELNLMGGFVFTGFLLGISFLLGAALIIYYKQYTEGTEDKKSYRILQEVGMSKEAVRHTINSQTIFVFFLPLAMAVLHFIFALTMLKQMLLLFGVTSSNHVYLVSSVTILIIIVIYFIIYRFTSKTYYRIIER
ncbi:FtsX-like permease family protein [Streptococcus caprae]|uniref:FtsX-like permease family protein n=1 Tax=Streptococcus caprae TaxID=1640501 RepID=A0ABV8CY01_9STRE